jgi:hypothetical protein
MNTGIVSTAIFWIELIPQYRLEREIHDDHGTGSERSESAGCLIQTSRKSTYFSIVWQM